MKRFALISCAFLLSIGAFAQQYQNPEFARLLKEDLSRAGCNNNNYEFRSLTDTPAPKGYKPFYISHYGRHGARSDFGSQRYLDVISILSEAKTRGLLTSDGDSLLNLAVKVNYLHDGMDGRLTRKGAAEHQKIAERMYYRYPRVFRKGSGNVRAVSSTVPRCIVSMAAFTDRLSSLDPKLNISWDTGEKFYAYINNHCPKDVLQVIQARMDSLDKSYVPDTMAFYKRIFTDPQKASELIPDAVKFESEVFATGKPIDAFDMEGSIFGLMPFDAVYKWFEQDNLFLYMTQCNSKEYGPRRMAEAEPLVKDIVTKADEAIAGGKYCADLRFGHDYPEQALASYLGVEGPGDRLSLEEARRQWFAPFLVPFAVNLQLVFYRNKDNDVLVKVLFNEQEVKLRGLEPVSGPYYRWNDVKANIKGYLRY